LSQGGAENVSWIRENILIECTELQTVSGIKALHESLLLVSPDEMDQLKHIQGKEAAGLLWIWGSHRGLCGLPHRCCESEQLLVI
jgi:uncharacterized protein YuzE